MPKLNTKPAVKTATATATPTPATVATVATVAPAKAPTAIDTHLASGVTAAHYAGLSPYLNANRKPRVNVYTGRNPSTLTARMLGLLRAVRDAYNGKQFKTRGFDNAIISHLCSAGMLSLNTASGSTLIDNGKTFAIDGESPLTASVTPRGLAFGKAETAKPKAIAKA